MRIKGSVSIPTNYEPLISGPFDARTLVQYKSDLTTDTTWRRADGSMYIYDGMLVGVSKDSIENNGYYVLQDKNKFNLESSWIKLSNINDLEEIKGNYITKTQAEETIEFKKYEIESYPSGSVVDYTDKEIRFYCPEGTIFHTQQVGPTGDKNKYYVPFKAYAPNNAVYFKEDMNTVILDETMYEFVNNDFAGIDEYGRKYSLVWLAIAYTNDDGVTWNYYGNNSTINHQIGYNYSVEWYDENRVLIGWNSIRINLSNKNCYTSSDINTDMLVNGEEVLVFNCGNANN